MFRYFVYAVLITWVLGFGYFIYNWIKCIMSRPPQESDGSSDDEDNIGEDVRQRKRIQQELQHVLP